MPKKTVVQFVRVGSHLHPAPIEFARAYTDPVELADALHPHVEKYMPGQQVRIQVHGLTDAGANIVLASGEDGYGFADFVEATP